MAKCRYFACVRIASPRGDDGCCNACRARNRYWDDKEPWERLERRRKLELSGETMSEFISDSKLKVYVRKEHVKEKKSA